MKKLIILLTAFILTGTVNAAVLEAGISIDDVPKALFGTWQIRAKLDKTNSYSTFRPQSMDMWNLSRNGDVLTLDNPFNGATAEVSVKTVEGNLIIFSKKLPYGNNKVLTDTVSLRLEDNKFSGINSLVLESYSSVDKHLIKAETATYVITGEKISGESILN